MIRVKRVANFGLIVCSLCGEACKKNGPVQKYCDSCSEKKDLERKKLWAREHPKEDTPEVIEKRAAYRKTKKMKRKSAGAIISKDNAESITWDASKNPELLWMARVSVPFTYASSKNHIYAMSRNGHRYLRKESSDCLNQIASALREAVKKANVVHNKIWIDILAQKPNHKGDAVNVLDLVCDAIKQAIPVDDRWYSVRRLDWQVVKTNPRLFIGIGQDSDVDSQVCCYCGRILPFAAFTKRTKSFLGIGRECRDCLRLARKMKVRGSIVEDGALEVTLEAIP